MQECLNACPTYLLHEMLSHAFLAPPCIWSLDLQTCSLVDGSFCPSYAVSTSRYWIQYLNVSNFFFHYLL